MVSDITLAGGKRGPEIVRDVRAARPQAAVLLMSGHPAADAPDHEYPLIGKPFSRDQFANAVRQAINGRAAAS